MDKPSENHEKPKTLTGEKRTTPRPRRRMEKRVWHQPLEKQYEALEQTK